MSITPNFGRCWRAADAIPPPRGARLSPCPPAQPRTAAPGSSPLPLAQIRARAGINGLGHKRSRHYTLTSCPMEQRVLGAKINSPQSKLGAGPGAASAAGASPGFAPPGWAGRRLCGRGRVMSSIPRVSLRLAGMGFRGKRVRDELVCVVGCGCCILDRPRDTWRDPRAPRALLAASRGCRILGCPGDIRRDPCLSPTPPPPPAPGAAAISSPKNIG